MRLSLRNMVRIVVTLFIILNILTLVRFGGKARVELMSFDGAPDTTLVKTAAPTVEAWLLRQHQELDRRRGERPVPVSAANDLPKGMWRLLDRELRAVPRDPGVTLVVIGTDGQVKASTAAELLQWPATVQLVPRGWQGRTFPAPPYLGAMRIEVLRHDKSERIRFTINQTAGYPLRLPDGTHAGTLWALRYRLPTLTFADPRLPAPRTTPTGIIDDPDLERRWTFWNVMLLIASAIYFGCWLVLFFAISTTLGPIELLQKAATKLAAGDRTVRAQVDGASEVTALANAFNTMAENLERSETVRRQMVSDVAHELRTPITILRCRLEAMQDGLVKPDAQELQSLHEETLLLQRLVEDLQLLSLADAGQLQLHRSLLDLRAVVSAGVDAFVVQARGAGVELVLAASDPCPIEGDEQRLAQVVRNLIANALAHTPAGGHVELWLERRAGSVRLSCKDDGSGIPEDQLGRVFERFWRGDASRARGKGGAGLGLAIAKQWVEMHGGTISVTSAAGAGATFIVDLPTEHSS